MNLIPTNLVGYKKLFIKQNNQISLAGVFIFTQPEDDAVHAIHIHRLEAILQIFLLKNVGIYLVLNYYGSKRLNRLYFH